MTAEELGYLPIVWWYVFHLKDGHYAIDERKAELVESVDLYEEEN